MATDVILPRVDMDMTTGRISHWFVKKGERVEKGAPLFEIETDKAAMEIEAPASGSLQIVVEVGTQVPVGATVGWILAEGETVVTTAPASEASTDDLANAAGKSPADAMPTATAEAELSPASPSDIRATPLSRRLAADQGIDLAAIAGSGPKGRIQADDVTSFVSENLGKSGVSAALLNGAWLRQGAGDPIVMLHGFGANLDSWRLFVGSLPATLPIYSLDLPGHGGSPLGSVTDIDDIVASVVASLLAAGIVGGHLVGHSLGGAVATLVASSGKFAAKSLFLISPGGLGPEVNAGFINGFAAATSEAAIAAWMQELVEDEAYITPIVVKQTAAARQETLLAEDQTTLAKCLFPEGTQGFSIKTALKTLTIPTRVVFGRADRIIPASHANRLPGTVALHLFNGVGHMPHLEASDSVAQLLLQTLKSAN